MKFNRVRKGSYRHWVFSNRLRVVCNLLDLKYLLNLQRLVTLREILPALLISITRIFFGDLRGVADGALSNNIIESQLTRLHRLLLLNSFLGHALSDLACIFEYKELVDVLLNS